MLRLAAFAICLSIASAGLTPSYAQRFSAELKALDARLPGDLINDPTRIDWEIYGNEVSSEPVVDPSIPGGGAALQIEVRNPGEYIYVAGANLPLIKKVDQGDTVTVGFYARTISSAAADGKGVMRVRFQQNAAPYPGFGEETLSLSKQWDWYEVTAKAEQALRKKDGIVALQFGRAKQTIQIGQAIIVKGASAIASQPAPKKQVTSETVTLPQSLQGAGQLINDPAKSDWYFGGTAGSWDAQPDTQIFGATVTRIAVTKADAKPHDLFVSIPTNAEISEGDEIIVAVAAKTESSAHADAKSRIKLRLEEAQEPYEGFGDNTISVGPKWQLLRIQTKATKALAAGKGQLALHLANGTQTLDLGPVYVIRKGS